jgi:hypothetical protein
LTQNKILDNFTFRTALLIDAEHISYMHLEAFGDGFLKNLGKFFLKRMYRKLIKKSSIKIVVLDSKGSLCGFAIGGFEGGLITCIRPQDLVILIFNMVFKPKVANQLFFRIKNIFINFLKSNEGYESAKNKNISTEIELSHIAIAENQRSNGIGGILINEFEKKAVALKKFHISTRTHNKRLCNYYIENKNAKIVSTIKNSDETSYILKWSPGDE